mmetsp:Transcript_14072/g.42079  ORF Transcript_14072/g.42079 Transcript_14072/m.42079 type:complete len:234 (-) Transcript_14072:303-1004(-)
MAPPLRRAPQVLAAEAVVGQHPREGDVGVGSVSAGVSADTSNDAFGVGAITGAGASGVATSTGGASKVRVHAAHDRVQRLEVLHVRADLAEAGREAALRQQLQARGAHEHVDAGVVEVLQHEPQLEEPHPVRGPLLRRVALGRRRAEADAGDAPRQPAVFAVVQRHPALHAAATSVCKYEVVFLRVPPPWQPVPASHGSVGAPPRRSTVCAAPEPRGVHGPARPHEPLPSALR